MLTDFALMSAKEVASTTSVKLLHVPYLKAHVFPKAMRIFAKVGGL